VDESSFTGETDPVRKNTIQLKSIGGNGTPLSERKNIAFMGTLVCHGRGKVRLYKMKHSNIVVSELSGIGHSDKYW
jgi:magnesium-transporting ATPase (P-type)